MTAQSEGGSTIEWDIRTPDIISTGFWDDFGYWGDDVQWADDAMWTTVSTGDRTD